MVLRQVTPSHLTPSSAAKGAGGDAAFTVAQAGQRVIVPADKHDRDKKYKVCKRQAQEVGAGAVPLLLRPQLARSLVALVEVQGLVVLTLRSLRRAK